jgi:hypothetical protein
MLSTKNIRSVDLSRKIFFCENVCALHRLLCFPHLILQGKETETEQKQHRMMGQSEQRAFIGSPTVSVAKAL